MKYINIYIFIYNLYKELLNVWIWSVLIIYQGLVWLNKLTK